MKEQTINRAKLGAFVLIGTTFLLLGLYFIGTNKNVFHSSIKVSANFTNVNGLLAGNNVRFNGINVGTVSMVYAVADTSIKVEFTLDKGLTQFISKNSIASIGTDGLLGSKLINISPGGGPMQQIQENDVLNSLNPLQMDNAMRTLVKTNENLEVISDNLKGVSEKLNNSSSLWNLLGDSLLAQNVRNAVVRFKLTGDNTATITGDLREIMKDVKAGKGTIGSLLTDTSFSHRLNQTIINIKTISDTIALVSGDFKSISGKLKNVEGSIGTLLTDTMFVHNLNQSMETIKKGAGNFNENMEALKYSWPFKKYFRKKK
jgi:phospholipid/cholesterol/gamma-HCH transport system substrate-binding protein